MKCFQAHSANSINQWIWKYLNVCWFTWQAWPSIAIFVCVPIFVCKKSWFIMILSWKQREFRDDGIKTDRIIDTVFHTVRPLNITVLKHTTHVHMLQSLTYNSVDKYMISIYLGSNPVLIQKRPWNLPETTLCFSQSDMLKIWYGFSPFW